MSAAEKGTVYLVGAGPGDPELLTLKAAALLRSADLVLHDDLVPDDVIAMAGGQALVVSVGKRCGVKRVHQSEIHALMIEAARRQLSVVRLKSGDPLVFGRAAEEMDALRAAGVPFEVVPGITAAFAAAAQIGCSLTDRRTASSVELHTGHKAADADRDVSGKDFSGQGFSGEAVTRVVYMPGRSFRSLAEERLRAGDAPDLPCCVISRAAQPDQSIRWSTLRELGEVEPGPAPVLLMTGWALLGAAARNVAESREALPHLAADLSQPGAQPAAQPSLQPAHDL
jgi:uroporphyrin-III C-methyltransferase